MAFVMAWFFVGVAVGQEADKVKAEGGKAQVAITHHFKSGDLIGLGVRNKAGETLGRVDDLVVDLKSGDVRYIALASGGVAGIGATMHAVPWNAMSFHMGQPNDVDARYFVFDVTKDQLDKAKGFDTSHWPNVADAHWAATVGKDAQRKEPADKVASDKAASDKVASDKAASERPNVAYETVFRASKIDGMDVRNHANEDLGAISEVMIDVTKGMVKYLVLSHGTVLTGGNKLFAVPLSQITLAHANDETFVKCNFTNEQLKNAPGFTSNSWPSTSDAKWRDVDAYYERTVRRETTTTTTRP
jgi:sporulation protein YlmC with PRC-barrel domain